MAIPLVTKTTTRKVLPAKRKFQRNIVETCKVIIAENAVKLLPYV